MPRPWKLLLAAAIALQTALACSSTLYSSASGAGGWLRYDFSAGVALGFPPETPLLAVAFPFQPYRSAGFRAMRLALSCEAEPCEFTLELRRDAGGVPGSVIESFLTYAGIGMVRSRIHTTTRRSWLHHDLAVPSVVLFDDSDHHCLPAELAPHCKRAMAARQRQ
jgi:hypothetical protein